MAPKTPQRHLESMQLILQVWLYIRPEQLAPVSQHMASSFGRLLKASWTVNLFSVPVKNTGDTSNTVQLEREKINEKSPDEVDEKYATETTVVHVELAGVDISSLHEDDVFSRIEIGLCSTNRIISPEKRAETFSNILQHISMEFRRHSFYHFTGLDTKGKRIIAWQLGDPTSGGGAFKPKKPKTNQFVAWVLPPPVKNATEKPAGNIQAELYKLATIKQRRPQTDLLKPVEAHYALKGLENKLLYQKNLYDRLEAKQKILQSADLEEGSVSQHIDEYVEILEHLDRALSGVIAIYDHSIGRRNFTANFIGQRDRHGFAAFRLRFLRSIGIHKYGTIKINDKHLEELKDRARQALHHVQRVAPILAAHARLRQSEASQKLMQLCNLASEGPEKLEFPYKMGIQPLNLNSKKAQIASLAFVSKCYEESREKLLFHLEALDGYLAKEVSEKGPKIFRRRLTFESLVSELFPPAELIQRLPHYYTYEEDGHCVKKCDPFYHEMDWCEKMCYDKEASLCSSDEQN